MAEVQYEWLRQRLQKTHTHSKATFTFCFTQFNLLTKILKVSLKRLKTFKHVTLTESRDLARTAQ